jgi:pimeloyl-ACP methyl ester carboxylesterase
MEKIFRRKFMLIVPALLALLALGYLYQQGMEARDWRRHPPPGDRVEVGGYELHIHCTGEGSPTVVLDAGLGSFSMDWVAVQPSLAAITRSCSFDRAGYGWSDRGPEPRDIAQNARELQALLEAADEPGPYILVGHSLGGAHVWRFAQEHPEDVAGVVLVDVPDHAELRRDAEDAAQRERTQLGFYRGLQALSSVGILRLLAAVMGEAIAPSTIHELPEDQKPAHISVLLRSEFYRTGVRELRELAAGAEGLDGDGALGDTPLIVITATIAEIEGWTERQAALLDLSSQSEQRLAEGSTHLVHIDRPDVIIEAVEDLMEMNFD